MRVLYLSYDGMTDQLGRSQVLPYVVGLAKRGHRFTLISCEKPERSKAERAVVTQICAGAGVRWVPLTYHWRPPVLSTVYDILAMRRRAFALHRQEPFQLVHCRSYMAALVGLAMKRRFGVPFIFDVRSFLPDERVESGLWPRTNPLFRMVYRYFKSREADFIAEAAMVVVQTRAGRDDLLSWQAGLPNASPITVIPCCADLATFTPTSPVRRRQARQKMNLPIAAKCFIYLGSTGSWYMLPEMLDLFSEQLRRDPKSIFLVVTRDLPEVIEKQALQRGIPADSLIIRPATREEVPDYLAAADCAISLIQPLPSKRGSAPVKLGEYLATHLPVLANGEVGDVADIIADTGGGVLIEDFSPDGYAKALDALSTMAIDPDRLDAGVRRWFDLDHGIEAYSKVYDQLTVGRQPPAR